MRGYFAIGVYHPKNHLNIGTLWRTANILKAAFIFTVGARYKRFQCSDTLNTPQLEDCGSQAQAEESAHGNNRDQVESRQRPVSVPFQPTGW